jgi:hypothetical protein
MLNLKSPNSKKQMAVRVRFMDPPVKLGEFHSLSDVEFEIRRQKLSEWVPVNPVAALTKVKLPELSLATEDGRVLQKDDINICLKIMFNRGNTIPVISHFVKTIEDALSNYPDFLTWKNDSSRQREPMSVVEVTDYAFRAKRYNQK